MRCIKGYTSTTKLTIEQELQREEDKSIFAYCMLAIALFQIMEALLTNYSIFVISRLGVKIKSSVLTLMFNKVLKMSLINGSKFPEGKVMN